MKHTSRQAAHGLPGSRQIPRLLDLEQVADGDFLGHQPEHTILDKVYGGQLFAQALAAAARTVDTTRPAHSAQGLFLEAGGHEAPIRYRVERVRDGRSFSARSVVATQGDRTLLRLAASFHSPEPGLEHASLLPDVPAPEVLPTFQDVIRDFSELPHEPWYDEWSGFEIRYAVSEQTGSRTPGPGRQPIWIRVRDRLPDDPALHRLALAYLSDIALLNSSLLPHGLVMGDPELPRATLNHTVWLHDEARVDDWLLVDQRSPWAGAARGLALAEVFTPDGRHVASFAQEGLVRPRGELRRRLGLE